jgi:hypothetical protein
MCSYGLQHRHEANPECSHQTSFVNHKLQDCAKRSSMSNPLILAVDGAHNDTLLCIVVVGRENDIALIITLSRLSIYHENWCAAPNLIFPAP